MNGFAFVFLAALAGGAAAAQMPSVPSGLSPGEVLLQISATGEERRPADDIGFKLALRATGADSGEADAALAAKLHDVSAALAKVGVDRQALSVAAPSLTLPPAVIRPLPNGAAPANLPKTIASETLSLKLGSVAQLHAAEALVDGQSVSLMGTAKLALRDDRPAHEAATVDAFAKAKEAGRLQASLMDMHVVRAIRVSNYGPLGDMDLLTQPFVQMIRSQQGSDDFVLTTARVYIDFALAPGK